MHTIPRGSGKHFKTGLKAIFSKPDDFADKNNGVKYQT
jgi:hypothetical protein